MHIFKIFAFLFLISVCWTKQITKVNKRLRKVEEQQAAIQSRAESTNSLIEEMARKLKAASLSAATADTCSTGFDMVLDSLGNIEDKIENIEAGTGDGNNVSAFTRVMAGNGSNVQVSVEQAFTDCMIFWKFDPTNNAGKVWCLRVALWQYFPQAVHLARTKRDAAADPFGNVRLDEAYIEQNDPATPSTGFRVRREYRNLTDQQREDFHDALGTLYEDGTIERFAETHRCGITRGGVNRIHRGNAFLPWHRAFTAMFEEALRSVNNLVVLPYWDSTIEDNLESGVSASTSSLFSRKYMGNPRGRVRSGPADDWFTSNGALRRRVGRTSGGRPIRQSDIDNLMTIDKCSYASIADDLEGIHNRVHVFIGGTMGTGISPYDPIFYLHHAFIDKIWQDFREHQINDCFVDPVTDYPIVNKDGHLPDDIMGEMNFLKNIDGMAAYWVEESWYRYAPSPRCPNCYGEDIYCDNNEQVCKPVLRFQMSDTPASIRRTAEMFEKESQQQHDSFGQTLMKKNAYHGDPCNIYPYMSRCPKQIPPRVSNMTLSAIAVAMCAGRIPYSKYAGKIQAQLDKENAEAELDPPVNGPKFFEDLPQISSDKDTCRSPGAIVYDLLVYTERRIDLRWMK